MCAQCAIHPGRSICSTRVGNGPGLETGPLVRACSPSVPNLQIAGANVSVTNYGTELSGFAYGWGSTTPRD